MAITRDEKIIKQELNTALAAFDVVENEDNFGELHTAKKLRLEKLFQEEMSRNQVLSNEINLLRAELKQAKQLLTAQLQETAYEESNIQLNDSEKIKPRYSIKSDETSFSTPMTTLKRRTIPSLSLSVASPTLTTSSSGSIQWPAGLTVDTNTTEQPGTVSNPTKIMGGISFVSIIVGILAIIGVGLLAANPVGGSIALVLGLCGLGYSMYQARKELKSAELPDLSNETLKYSPTGSRADEIDGSYDISYVNSKEEKVEALDQTNNQEQPSSPQTPHARRYTLNVENTSTSLRGPIISPAIPSTLQVAAALESPVSSFSFANSSSTSCSNDETVTLQRTLTDRALDVSDKGFGFTQQAIEASSNNNFISP